MAKKKILVVDDEEDILELVRYNLSREGYDVLSAGTGEEAIQLVTNEKLDLMVLDLMLPEMDGLEVTRMLKKDPQTALLPIVMLTAKGEEADVVTGLEMGADDYVTKPFSPRILSARIRAILRRQEMPAPGAKTVIRAFDLEVDPGKCSVKAGGNAVDLTYTEFQVLYLMIRRPGWVFTRSMIVDAVRGNDYPVTDRSVDVQIVGLRKKLGDHGKLIETVRGVGYRFKETE